jgi:hypothetical protein
MNGDPAFMAAALQAAIDTENTTRIAKYEADTQRALEATKAGNKAGADALRAVTLLNGGAAVAILAFIGQLASKGASHSAISSLRLSLILFVGGTIFAVFGSAATYFAHFCILRELDCEFAATRLKDSKKAEANRKRKRWHSGNYLAHATAVLFGLLALACFIAASYKAYSGFEQIGRTNDVLAAL